MSAIPVLLAGTVGSGTQNHQADQWGPSLAAAGFRVETVWTPSTVGEDAIERARLLAASFQVELQIAEQPSTSASGAIVCLRGAERVAFAAFAADRQLPVLLDKPTLDTTAELEEFAAALGTGTVLPGHHFQSHPGFTRALTAVHGAEVGLLRAVHADLVSGGGELSMVGELRNLGVYFLDLIRQTTGPASVTVQAHASPEKDSWSFLGKTDRDVIVSVHVSRASKGDTGVRALRANLRFVGTHGSILVNLAKPSINLSTTAGARTLSFIGEGSVVAHLKRFATAIRGTGRTVPASDFVTLSRALDGIAASAASEDSASITW